MRYANGHELMIHSVLIFLIQKPWFFMKVYLFYILVIFQNISLKNAQYSLHLIWMILSLFFTTIASFFTIINPTQMGGGQKLPFPDGNISKTEKDLNPASFFCFLSKQTTLTDCSRLNPKFKGTFKTIFAST